MKGAGFIIKLDVCFNYSCVDLSFRYQTAATHILA